VTVSVSAYKHEITMVLLRSVRTASAKNKPDVDSGTATATATGRATSARQHRTRDAAVNGQTLKIEMFYQLLHML
jgi:hypothetical protein